MGITVKRKLSETEDTIVSKRSKEKEKEVSVNVRGENGTHARSHTLVHEDKKKNNTHACERFFFFFFFFS